MGKRERGGESLAHCESKGIQVRSQNLGVSGLLFLRSLRLLAALNSVFPLRLCVNFLFLAIGYRLSVIRAKPAIVPGRTERVTPGSPDSAPLILQGQICRLCGPACRRNRFRRRRTPDAEYRPDPSELGCGCHYRLPRRLVLG